MTLNEINGPLDILDGMVKLPLKLFKTIVPLLLEEEHLGTASYNYGFIKNHLHLPELHFSNFLKSKDCDV